MHRLTTGRRKGVVVTPAILFTMLILTAGPSYADNCVGTKLTAIGKREAGLLSCQTKIAAENDTSGLMDCEMEVSGKFSTSFGKAGSCVGDEITCEATADDCETAVFGRK